MKLMHRLKYIPRIFRTRYRIVKDDHLGFEAQFRYWWMPLYNELDWSNTHHSVDSAERMINNRKSGRVVKYL